MPFIGEYLVHQSVTLFLYLLCCSPTYIKLYSDLSSMLP